ncbi:hypothetical protein [Brevibacillus nitrificans]|uniref:hypothetical protein n=1 Tax=Brevibacillus nitrificans TaxID=651560 RepID=UPI00286B56DB|nr:hypothetical protein [Brevibacillus nitrificans]
MEEASRFGLAALHKLQAENVSQWNRLKQGLKESIGQYLYSQTKRRPMILPIIMDV